MRASSFALQAAQSSATIALHQDERWRQCMLGGLRSCRDAVAAPMADAQVPCPEVCMPRSDGKEAVCEGWHREGEVAQGRHGAIHDCHDDTILFGVMALLENAVAIARGKTPLRRATESAYRAVCALADALQFSYVDRFWKYLLQINVNSDGLQRYRHFNLGRADVLAARPVNGATCLPAACALGSARGLLSSAFLASRQTPLCIEKPRQVSAHD